MNAITQPQTLITCETTEEWTQERKEAFDKASAYPHPSTSVINATPTPCGEVPHNPTQVQGVSGAVYAPMDTSPTPPQTGLDPKAIIDEMMTQFQLKLNLLVTALQRQTDAQTDLEEAVSVSLEQADWFRHRVEEATQEHIDNMDLDYEIGNQVERYMRNEFDPEDHVDFYDLVSSKVDDVIDDIVNDKIADALEERLADLLEEKLKDANITINF